MPRTAMAWFRLLLRVALAGLFLYAGALKLADPGGFAQDLLHYRVLPESMAAPLAVGLPVLEVVLGLGLLTRAYMNGAALLAAASLAVFAAAMAQAKVRGINLDCGCFGAAASMQVSWTKVAINLGLAILCSWIARPSPNALGSRLTSAKGAPGASPSDSGSSPA
jgi:uncharacterized membrane protein YphA (DoxX/SURF4 family)